MKIIVGLGNPGEKYINTRHNLGFMVIEELKKLPNSQTPKLQANYKFKFQKKFNAEILKTKALLLVKPQTFMNSSGIAVKKILQDYKKTTSGLQDYNNLYVVHDDLDLSLGDYKIQFGKGAAGHHGVESIIKELGTNDFWRLRIGIKSQFSIFNFQFSMKKRKNPNYVLGRFSNKEKEIVDRTIKKAITDLKEKLDD